MFNLRRRSIPAGILFTSVHVCDIVVSGRDCGISINGGPGTAEDQGLGLPVPGPCHCGVIHRGEQDFSYIVLVGNESVLRLYTFYFVQQSYKLIRFQSRLEFASLL